MSTNSKADATYVMGHPVREEERLQKLGQLLYPSTRHLFEKPGIIPLFFMAGVWVRKE
jgi:hypothetical protein